MSIKRILGTLVLIVGVVLIGFALYAKHKINNAKEDVEGISHFLPKNTIGGAAGRTLHGEVSQYDNFVHWSLIGGIILVVLGVGTLVCYRKR